MGERVAGGLTPPWQSPRALSRCLAPPSIPPTSGPSWKTSSKVPVALRPLGMCPWGGPTHLHKLQAPFRF